MGKRWRMRKNLREGKDPTGHPNGLVSYDRLGDPLSLVSKVVSRMNFSSVCFIANLNELFLNLPQVPPNAVEVRFQTTLTVLVFLSSLQKELLPWMRLPVL
jgi:hypothetical protein